MSQNTLVKKLGKELARNRKKTAVLAIISLVAIWFWVPLVWEWVAPESNKVPPGESNEVALSPASTSTSPTPSSSSSTASEIDKLHWRRLRETFGGHPLMASASVPRQLATPFGQPPAEEPVTDEEAEEEAESQERVAIVEPTPAELGLRLSSTLVGAGIRIAVINGKTCELGSVLVVPYRSMEVEFKLVAVGPKSVELFDGRQVHQLHRAQPAHQMEVSSASGQRRFGSEHDENRIVIPTQNRD